MLNNNALSDFDLDFVTGGAGEKTDKDGCRLVGKEVIRDKKGNVVQTKEIYVCEPPAPTLD